MSKEKKPGWKELPRGGLILDAGNAHEYQTGGWRINRPEWIEENCIHCLFCWVYCPDSSIETREGKMTGINYEHCKGCGICAEVCPAKKTAIEMKPEGRKEDSDE